MFRFLATWMGRILTILILAVVVLAGAAAIFYFTDQNIDATVKEKHCGATPAQPSSIVAETKMFGFRKILDMDYTECHGIPQDAFVQFYVKSRRLVIFETEGGACLYDSALHGPCLQ